MRPVPELIQYLNDYFGAEVWRSVADLLGNLTVSDADALLREQPLCNGLRDSRLDFAEPPGFVDVGQERVRLRLPQAGQHRLETKVVTAWPLPDLSLRLDLRVEMVLGPLQPNPNIDIDVNLNWGSDFLAGLFSLPALLAKRLIEEAAEFLIPNIIRGQLNKHLGGLTSYRFDRSFDLVPAGGSPQLAGVIPPSFKGDQDPKATGYLDLLLVADGFDSTNIGGFNALVDKVWGHFTSTTSPPNEPFRSFSSVIRVWKMPLEAADPTNPHQRVAVPVALQGDRTLNFSNLARVAEVGLVARDFFSRDPLTVYVTLAPGGAGANAQGAYMLLPFTHHLPSFLDSLMHELGHTPLGHHLADESVVSGGTYRGPEPQSRNVSIGGLSQILKWQAWGSGGLEGAYDRDEGVFRFAEDCQMNNSAGFIRIGPVPYCPICCEELTLGSLEYGHQRAGTNGVSGMVDLAVRYLAPWSEAAPRNFHADGGGTLHLEALTGGLDSTSLPLTEVELEVVGSSVPAPWVVTWQVRNLATGATTALAGNRVIARVRPGFQIEVGVAHAPAATPLLSAGHPNPTTSVRLVFDPLRQVAPSDLLPPTDLTQSVPVGSVISLAIEAATGRLSHAPVRLQAKLGAITGYDLPVGIEFRLDSPAPLRLNGGAQQGPQGEERRWYPDRVLPSGNYTWSARTTWRRVLGAFADAPQSAGGVCFAVGPIPFDTTPRPPVAPFDLTILETATFPPLPSGFQATSWHPNDRSIDLQFEMKLEGDLYDGLNFLPTGVLIRDAQNTESVAITGHVLFGRQWPFVVNSRFKWRVRTMDDMGQASNWVEGRPFALFTPAQRPTTLRDLAEVLRRLDGRMFDPRGPIGVPRLFFAEAGQRADGEADLSWLDRLLLEGQNP